VKVPFFIFPLSVLPEGVSFFCKHLTVLLAIYFCNVLIGSNASE
jgi:hypothetical protein